MADMHVLSGDGSNYRVVMHFAVPGGSNAVGVTWVAALLASLTTIDDLGNTVLPPTVLLDGDGTGGTITAAEKALIEAGTLHEHSRTFRIESGGTSNAELRAALWEFYSQEKTRLTGNLQVNLKYFGHTESEA